jgi:EmrB/QacA subfamily drug resistance transporter
MNPTRAQRNSTKIVLAIILTCQLMVVLDISVIITALPKIEQALHFSTANLSWVQNAYALTFGGLLLLGARAGDILGRRRVFVFGIGLFTVASFAGGLAQSEIWLLTARAFQGVGAAIAAPSTLALLTVTFKEGKERTRAVAYYSSVSAAGGSVGLVLGGMLTDWISWRWGLFINVPIGIALMVLAPRYLPETERQTGKFDVLGAATSTLGMSAVVYGFVRAASDGWSNSGAVASFAIGAALLVGFVLTERRAEQPITPLRLFASRERSGAYATRMFVVGAMFSMFFFLSQFMQGVDGFSPLKAGIAFLPMTIVMFAMIRVIPRVMARIGGMPLLVGGLLTALAGMIWLSQISLTTGYFPGIAVPMVLLGIGIGTAFTPMTASAITGVEPEDAGAASGLVNVSQQLGGSVGLGILVTVFASAGRSAAEALPAGASEAFSERYELAHSVGAAVTGSAVFLAIALTIAVTVMWRPTRGGQQEVPAFDAEFSASRLSEQLEGELV